MDHEPVLISTIAIGLTAAFIGGLIARRLRLPEIVGYIAAGVAIGPFTPGLVADTEIALELAELGVILLMFGVGIHFSLRDLLAVRASPSRAPSARRRRDALGIGLGSVLGWGLGGGLVLGLALSVASTVVLLRALSDRTSWTRRRAASPSGGSSSRTCSLCWSSCCCRPSPRSSARRARAPTRPLPGRARSSSIAIALGKAALFAVVMVVVGARVVPWLMPGRRARGLHASCSRWQSSPSRWGSPSSPRACSASRSRSARSWPAWS